MYVIESIYLCRVVDCNPREGLENLKSIVAFLVINQIKELPIASIRSVLENSDSEIRVGYLNDIDIEGLDISSRVKFVRLRPLPDLELQGVYKDFSESLFYQIVQLKWQLLETLFLQDFDIIIYSDLDVIWISNPVDALQRVFSQDSGVAVQIQSFTTDPSDPKLCMGFVAFRNVEASRSIVTACKEIHLESLKSNYLTGDDDVITKYYSDNNYTSKIRLLPQSTFPVGSLLNLFTTRPTFPGLGAPKPYIFHLNYVVGLQNKRLMLRVLGKKFKIKTQGLIFWRVLITVKYIRIIVSGVKKQLLFLLKF